ncbi:APC family permease [Nocardioides albidus]|uniref:APC family permease n=1 Tax=Nocardioides albidus TaxID=1517589 RepID=A0A5C4WR96_9ACTN|nr:APC family permease [Nocardioides albidus]TNM50185.1 APC family permease [Nocardioides albidus]
MSHPTGRFQRVLGTPELILFGLAYMVPLTVFTTYGVVTDLTGGHLPGAYVLTLAAMLFTAYSYGRMVIAHPYAGSAYTYTQKAFGAHVGFLAGWSLLLDYVFLPMINYLVIGIFLEAQWPAVPAWVWILVSIAIVTGLNVLGIKMVSRMNLVLVGAQVVFIVVFVGTSVVHLAGSGTPSLVAPFFGSGAQFSTLASGAAILCLSFLGFDAISTLSEEARDARRTIPRAIWQVTLYGGLLFIALAWVGHLVFPDPSGFTDVDAAATDVMRVAGGAFLVSFFTAAYVAGCFASAMASQASVARILFAMGRDGVLPRAVFGRLHARYRTPALAILVVGATSLTALVISLSLAAAMISFGALVAFSMVNLSVVKHYLVDEGRRGGAALLRYGVVPVIGFALTAWLWTSLSATTFKVGLTWFAVGLVYLAVITRGFKQRPPVLDLSEDAADDAEGDVPEQSTTHTA